MTTSYSDSYPEIHDSAAFDDIIKELKRYPSKALFLQHRDYDLPRDLRNLQIKYNPRSNKFHLHWSDLQGNYKEDHDYYDSDRLFALYNRGYYFGRIE